MITSEDHTATITSFYSCTQVNGPVCAFLNYVCKSWCPVFPNMTSVLLFHIVCSCFLAFKVTRLRTKIKLYIELLDHKQDHILVLSTSCHSYLQLANTTSSAWDRLVILHSLLAIDINKIQKASYCIFLSIQ